VLGQSSVEMDAKPPLRFAHGLRPLYALHSTPGLAPFNAALAAIDFSLQSLETGQLSLKAPLPAEEGLGRGRKKQRSIESADDAAVCRRLGLNPHLLPSKPVRTIECRARARSTVFASPTIEWHA